MNNVKLLHIKCCFFQFFNSPVALKKNSGPQEKVEMTLLVFNTIFVSSHMYPENPEGTQVIVGSMNMGYISDSVRNLTHNLFRPKCEPIPLGHRAMHVESSIPVCTKCLIYYIISQCLQSLRSFWGSLGHWVHKCDKTCLDGYKRDVKNSPY